MIHEMLSQGRRFGCTSLQRFSGLVRLRPHDASTEAGRAQERNRRAALTALASFASRLVGTFTSIISVPLTINYLDKQRYGLWMAMSSLILFCSLADLGLANGLLNCIARAHGTNDRSAAQRYVSSAFAVLGVVAVVLGIAFGVAHPFLDWRAMFNITEPGLAPEAALAIAVFAGCFLVGLPLGLVAQVQLGFQEGFVNSLWAAGAAVVSLAGVCVVVYLRAGLPWLILAVAGAPVLGNLGNAVVLFGWRRPWLRPRWAMVELGAVRHLLGTGIFFVILSLANIALTQTGTLVLTQMVSLEAVTVYAVPYRLFAFAPSILAYLLMSLWPAYGEALARGDVRWIRQTLFRATRIGLAVNGSVALLLVVLGVPIIHLWTRRSDVTPPLGLMIGLGMTTVLNAFCGSFAVFLNGLHMIRFQVVCAICTMVTNLLLCIGLVHFLGVAGVAYSTALSMLLCTVIPSTLFIRRKLEQMRQMPTPVAAGADEVQESMDVPVAGA